jgi:hypothetical protein
MARGTSNDGKRACLRNVPHADLYSQFVRCHWVGLTFVRHYAVKQQDHDARNGVILVDRHDALPQLL